MKTTTQIPILLKWAVWSCFILLFGQCQPARPSLQAYRLNKSGHVDEEQLRTELVSFARSFIGCKYKRAGKDKSGFDCSGFVKYVFNEYQIQMAASAHEQALNVSATRTDEALKGDLVFFSNQNKIVHVGIITDNKKDRLMVIHSTSSKGVIEENILKSDYWIRRMHKVCSLNNYLHQAAVSLK
ncbi:MAG: C40 family peptidase [Saprospiraceae bacterium]|nr:C40 family peptidase [Saprospiraceae bacterium]MBK7737938.1 C40 family peptidase [Saprospiraceae bacterium]MBK7913483.1 C40 family peptidase [Saprospiraceae bacterium]